MSTVCQAVLDVGAIVEIKMRHSLCLHGAYYAAIGLSTFQGIHLFCIGWTLCMLKDSAAY